MISSTRTVSLSRWLPLLAIVLLAGCTIAQPRTDDPLEKYNRKAYKFNNAVDKAIIRPVAVGYRKITNPPIRTAVTNFFTTIRMPITVVNDLLQARPKQALEGTGRLVVNLTIGFVGLFDPASAIGIPLDKTDFGVTLARWGFPEGDYLMLPLLGPSTGRDIWRIPVDGYFLNPIHYFSSNNSNLDGLQYIPSALYLVSLRASAIDAENFLNSAYDPYVFIRDAYRQQRLYDIYDGNPPDSVIQHMQGLDEKNFDPDQLLDQQHQWEKSHPGQTNDGSK